MKDGLGDLLPSRAFAKRMLELESELKRARSFQRRHSKSPETLGRWGLDTAPESSQQEEGWFLTYLDMMTLLLVVMIVMLAFSGTLNWRDEEPSKQLATSADVEPVSSENPTEATVEAADVVDSRALALPTVEAIREEDTDASAGTAGDGLLPGSTGLLPYRFGFANAVVVSEQSMGTLGASELPSPYSHPADIGPLPRDAQVLAADHSDPAQLHATSQSIKELYPGWAPADLSASFIGPPRPPIKARDDIDAVATRAPEAAEASAPSEGEAMAAGLSLVELGDDVEVVINERSVSFRVNSEILFDSSQADLSRSGLSVLRRIVSVLSETNHEITVEGHTDSVPVRRNVRFPSNWELSSSRAGSVVRYLQANGIERSRLKAVGYADTRPIADNHTPDGRASNRRVELLIEKRD